LKSIAYKIATGRRIDVKRGVNGSRFAKSDGPLMTIMIGHLGVPRSSSIEDMEQRANYVRGHKRELKWRKEAMGFYCRATWLKRRNTNEGTTTRGERRGATRMEAECRKKRKGMIEYDVAHCHPRGD